MKKLSLSIIHWIKDLIKNFQDDTTDPADFANADKAIKWLDDLPDLEYYCKKGGWIPDIYGNACKDGDKVVSTNKDPSGNRLRGTLTWMTDPYRFLIIWDNSNVVSPAYNNFIKEVSNAKTKF